MKKLLLFKKIIIVILLVGLSSAGWAQVIASDDFNYPDNTLLTNNGWVAHSGGGTAPIAVGTSNGLVYDGYSGLTGITGIIEGNAARIVNTGEDDSKVFTAPVSSGTIYFSFLTKITTGTAGYYLNLGGSTSAFASRIFVKPSTTVGKINFGISNTSTAVYATIPTDFDLLTTYLIIVKYDVTTTGNVSMWIKASGIPFTEVSSGSPEVTTSGTGQASIDRICLRQYAATQSMEVDGIRVGLTWADILPNNTPSITVTAPVSGNEWAQGSTHNITWTASGTNTNVKIEYTGNASDPTPIWSTVNKVDIIAASAGTYSLVIPYDISPNTDSKIRISDIPETTFGLSDKFSITAAPEPVATFVPANGATNIGIASDITISFDVPVRKIDNTDISDTDLLSLVTLKTNDASGTAVPFTASIDASKKVITINPDANLTNEQLYYVAIDPVEGFGDNATVAQSVTFTTAASLVPTISDVTITEVSPYYAGDFVTINWVSKNITDVQLEAWIPSGNKWEVIVPTTPSNGSVSFQIPIDAQYSTDYKIRVSDIATPTVSAESSTFTIIGAISEVSITEVAPYFAGDAIQLNWVAKNISTVKIELYDPATSIWSDLITNVTAADGKKVITLPSTLVYNTGYKLRISDEAVNSKANTESGIFEVDAVAADLLTLRAQPAGAKVKFTGIATVTYARTSRNQKYLQDATAAIVIDDPTPAPGFITGSYAIGDGITNVVGKITLYSGLVEFTPTSASGEPATGIAIVPEIRTLASLTAADQCKLVKIENFAFLTPTQYAVDGKFPLTSKSYDIDGFSNTVMVFRSLFTEADYMGGYVPAGPISSVVLVGQYNLQMQVTARSWSDMTVPTVADFNADKTFALTGENVTFTDMSSNHPTNWEWTFAGGTPATSTAQNPVVTYSAKGTYAVTLKATNAAGGTNTVTKTDYISTGVVGISTLSSTVSVYPNPTNGRLFITNASKDPQEITVFSAIGKQVNSSVSADGIISLDIKSQTKGIYLIRITNKNTKSVQVKKVVLY